MLVHSNNNNTCIELLGIVNKNKKSWKIMHKHQNFEAGQSKNCDADASCCRATLPQTTIILLETCTIYSSPTCYLGTILLCLILAGPALEPTLIWLKLDTKSAVSPPNTITVASA